MNIWQALALARNHEDLTLEQAKELSEGLGLYPWTFQAEFIRIMEERTGTTWFVCDGSGYLFPDWQAGHMVGCASSHNFVTVAQAYLDSDQDYYCYARDRRNEWGYDLVEECYFIEGEDVWITRQEFEYNYGRCESCNEYFPTDDLYYRETRDASYCERCDPGEEYDEDEDEDEEYDHNPSQASVIRNYSTRVEHVLDFTLDRNKRYFGLEVEMEFPGETPSYWAHWANENTDGLADMSIWKSDGSLNNGAELVTRPLTLERWQSDNALKALCNNKAFRKVAKSHNTTTCGLHIHVSRKTVSEPTVAKLVVLMNDPSMAETTTLIARRAPNTTYCSASKKKWLSDTNTGFSGAMFRHKEYNEPKPNPLDYVRPVRNIEKTQYPQGGRYSPVNLTTHTLEFRIFRGTLRWETILASIEFVDAVLWFCKLHGAGDMNATAFNKFLQSKVTRKTYPALRDYLELRTLFPKRKPAPLALDASTECRDVPEEEDVLQLSGTFTGQPADPHEGSRHAWHGGGRYLDYPGDHFEIDLDCVANENVTITHPNGDETTLILNNLQPGYIWWNEDRTCSLRFN